MPAELRSVPRVRDFRSPGSAQTRWTDNDMLATNNAIYYALWDSAINAWIAADAGGDLMTDRPAIPSSPESGCRYPGTRLPRDLVVGIGVDQPAPAVVPPALYAAGARPDDPGRRGWSLSTSMSTETRRRAILPGGIGRPMRPHG